MADLQQFTGATPTATAAPFYVEGPDGAIVEFPAGTDMATMERAMAGHYGTAPSATQPHSPQPTPEAQIIATTKDGGVVRRREDGTLGFSSPGMSTNDQETIKRIMEGATPADASVYSEVSTGGGIGAAARGALQGILFGFGDEVVARGISALPGGGSYEAELQRERARLAKGEEENAAAHWSGLIPGAVASSLAGWGALGVGAKGTTGLGTAARGAAMGAAEGGLYGAGNGEDTRSRIKGMLQGALAGGVVGAAAPAVVHGAAGAAGGVRDMIMGGVDAALNRGSAGRANSALMETLRRSGHTLDDVANAVETAAREGQPEFRLMDAMGIAGQRRANGIVRAGGDGAEEVAQFLRQRQMDQPDRMAGFVDEAFGMGGKSAKQTQDSLVSARGVAADVAYDAARKGAGPVDIRGVLAAIDDRIGPMRGSGVTGDGIDAILSRFRSRLAAQPGGEAFPGASSVELSDFDRVLGVKQDLQDAIGVAVRAGRNNEARELGKVLSQIDGALEGASGGYRAANDGFRQASRVIDAVDAGGQFAKRGRYPDTIAAFRAMTPEEQAAARAGYGDDMLGRIERNSASTANRAKVFSSTKAQQEADAMALDPGLFRNRLGRENTMWETQNRALGGSQTIGNDADVRGVEGAATIGRMLRDAVMGNPANATIGLVGHVAPKITGQNEATRALIAKALMSDNPRAALASAMAQSGREETRKQVAAALARAIGREAYQAR